MTHPLDDENILVVVKLEHIQTGEGSEHYLMCQADDDESIAAAITRVGEIVSDDLLARIESR